MYTLDNNLLISQRLYAHLEKEFPQPRIKPGADMDKAMYYAGAQAVLETIKTIVEKGQDIEPDV